MEWQGTAARVAFHSPYLLLFDSRFVEVRHIDTGRLVQIITGNDIVCTCDGRALVGQPLPIPAPLNGATYEADLAKPRVHVTMTSIQAGHSRSGDTSPSGNPGQCIFELATSQPQLGGHAGTQEQSTS